MKVGFIGLGVMGAPMVRRLLSRGFEVAVWNLEPERAQEVTAHGAVWCDTPGAVRAASDLVVLCVLDATAVEQVCLGPDGLSSQKGADLVLDSSTVPPEKTREIAGNLKDMSWIDAPVSGGPPMAESGGLTMLLGGTAEDIERADPVISALAANATHMGDLGAGQAAKTLNQAIVGVNYVLMAEVLALARSSGIDPARLPAALAGGMADSQILQRIYPQMEQRDFDPPKAYARQLRKDLLALADFVEAQGEELPLIGTAISRYRDYVDAGNEMADSASIASLYDWDRSER